VPPTDEAERTTPANVPVLFEERRRPPWWWWAVALAVALPSVEIVVVFAPDMTSHGSALLALATAAATVVLVCAGMLAISRSRVEVFLDGLEVDRATLPATAIGRVRELDPTTFRAVIGRDARADAQLCLRPWLRRGVQIEVVDPTDTTPYWVVATRRPTQLAEALRSLGVLGHRPSGDADRT
jgi:hypothetical protein